MSKWIRITDKFPTQFPCKGRNYRLHIEDVITGYDENNKVFEENAFFCKSIPLPGISMPFTHWMPLEEKE